MRSLLRQLLPEECRRRLTLQLCSVYAVLSLLCPLTMSCSVKLYPSVPLASRSEAAKM